MTKYIVVDPRYIIPRDMWASCCKKIRSGREFSNAVTKALQEFTGDNEARAVTTGGDWVNFVKGNKKKIIMSRFTADSGMVCFCRYNDIVKKALKKEDISEYCYAVLELDGDVRFVYDLYEGDWTEIFIFDNSDMLRTLSRDELNGDY